MAQHHTLEVMNNLHSIQKALDAHREAMSAVLSKAGQPSGPQELETRRIAAMKLDTAKDNLYLSRYKFQSALDRMATERQPMAVPGILKDAANKLHYANQQLNHPAIAAVCGQTSPITNAESMAVRGQAHKNYDYSIGKRR